MSDLSSYYDQSYPPSLWEEAASVAAPTSAKVEPVDDDDDDDDTPTQRVRSTPTPKRRRTP